MRKEIRIIIFIGCIIATIVIGVLVGENYYMAIPAPYPLASMGLGMWLMAELTAEIFRGRTEHVIFNAGTRGHRSIRSKDVHEIPWHEYSDSTSTKKDEATSTLTIMLTGGIDWWGFSTPGPANAPVLVTPTIYVVEEEHNFHAYTNFNRYEISELPRYVQDKLALYPKRITEATPIYYGTTSHLDGSATPENLEIERQRKDLNKENKELRTKIDELYKMLRQQKKAQQKDFFIGERVTPEEET